MPQLAACEIPQLPAKSCERTAIAPNRSKWRNERLVKDRPDNIDYLTLVGAVSARTQDRGRAAKQADAFARGLSMSTGLHRHIDLETLRGLPAFDELMKPKG